MQYAGAWGRQVKERLTEVKSVKSVGLVEQLAGVERGEVVVREVQLLESLVQPVERVCGHGVQLVV